MTREVPAGGAAATLLAYLQDAIRERIGAAAERYPHTVDMMTQEALLWLPVAQLTILCGDPEPPDCADDTLAAMSVLCARCREQLEARWGAKPATVRAIDLLMRAVVVELFSLWFGTADARHAICKCVELVRTQGR